MTATDNSTERDLGDWSRLVSAARGARRGLRRGGGGRGRRAKPPGSAATSRADTDDPAEAPLVEGGEGESEGFELAEKDLEDIAEHGDEHRFPDGMAQPEEPQDTDEYGEADEAIPPDENE